MRVAEQPVEVLVVEAHPVLHVVEDGLHHRSRPLELRGGGGELGLAVLQLGDVVVPGEQRLLAFVLDRVHRVERPPVLSAGAAARDLDVAHAAFAAGALEQAGALRRVDEQRDEIDAFQVGARDPVLPRELGVAEEQASILDRDGGADRAAFQDRAHALLVLLDAPLGALALGDVAVDRHEPAARQRVVADLQHGAVGPDPLGGVVQVDVAGDAGDEGLDIDVAVLAAPRQVADEIRIGRLAGEEIGRQVEHLLELTVARRELRVAVEHRDAMGHVVEHDLHHLARARDVAIGGGRLRLGAIELLRALPGLGDVAGRADHPAGASVRPAQHDAVLARPAHGAVRHAVAELAVEPRHVALEQGEHHAAVIGTVFRMDARGPLVERRAGRKILHRQQRRRQVDRARLDVPVVHVLVDRLQRERVALLVAGAALQRQRGAMLRGGGDGLALAMLDLGDVAGRAGQAVGAAVGLALRDAGLARPSPCAVVAAVAGVDLEARGQPLEVLPERMPIERHVVRMHPRHPVGRRGELGLAQAQHDAQRRRVEDRVGFDVPVVDAVVERLERERISLVGRRRRRSRLARRLGAPRGSSGRGTRWHQLDSRSVFLAAPRIVRISQDAEFVSFVSWPAQKVRRGAFFDPDVTIPTIQN